MRAKSKTKNKEIKKPDAEKVIVNCVKSHKKRELLGTLLSWMGGTLMPLMLISLTYGIIMISKGYRLTKEGQIIQTGVLSVTSNVRGASLYVNSEYKGNVPKVISGIELDTYEVNVRKTDYYNYNFTVPINPSYSFSVYSKLYKLPEKIVFEEIFADAENIYTSNNNKTVILKTNDKEKYELYKCTLSTTLISKPSCDPIFDIQENIDLADFNYKSNAYVDINTLRTKLSPNNQQLLLEITIRNKIETIEDEAILEEENLPDEEIGKELILLDLSGKDVEITSLDRIPQNIDQIVWSTDSKYLIFERENDLIAFDIDKESINIVVGSWENKDLEYQLINGSVIFWSENGLEIRDLDGKTYDPIVVPEQKFTNLSSEITQTFNVENTKLVTIDQSGLRPIVEKEDLMYVLDIKDNTFKVIPDCLTSQGCNFKSFSPDAEKALFQKENAYYLYWIEKEEWDYLTEDILYELFVCNERKCEIQWADDSSILFIWMQSYDDNEAIGEIWYCDFWGKNKNKLITEVVSNFIVTDKASRIHVGKVKNEEEIKIDFETAEIK
ncbi:MAG TPA: PEGA domain-containing protein [Candidatus Dojkabacteria bacterium]|nr:PEGA domain-containing protein [Candidatus Dojkabacteria bacterium]